MSLPVMGVVFRPQSPPEALREIVTAVDESGAAELWLWEDCFLEGGISTAAAALAWSDRVTVGIGLLPVPLRNPALAAMELATLERIAPGRLVAGLGHGVLDWMGKVGARAESPLTLLREYTTAVRALLAGETVDVEGRYVKLDGVALDWPPQTAPELVLGATRPKTLRLAGELADGVLLTGEEDLDGLRAARAIVDEGRAASGREGRARVITYAEVDPTGTDLRGTLLSRAEELAAAGADAVAFHGTAASPDPRPFLDALA
ncbi:LLM class flavin-dependent oxidoreductase [Microbacterium sp. JZ31]|uniref:LLM class flavin-dependent oxidoreductase n=1 Tax=Microbacterium sp. JZ31 TaxID=1906274 RepID=UPI0019347B0D|nr:LLM class flavin-dependent oxidoreductase [Microbacterium sp. JZ31]